MLWRAEYHSLAHLAFALTGDWGAAEDIAQDALFAAYRRWGVLGGYEKPGAWTRRVVIKRSRSRWRRGRAEALALARLASHRATVAPIAEDVEQFWAAVRALPRRQAQCVALHYLGELPAADIAGIIGCAEATVRVHLHRARAALARTLGMEEES